MSKSDRIIVVVEALDNGVAVDSEYIVNEWESRGIPATVRTAQRVLTHISRLRPVERVEDKRPYKYRLIRNANACRSLPHALVLSLFGEHLEHVLPSVVEEVAEERFRAKRALAQSVRFARWSEKLFLLPGGFPPRETPPIEVRSIVMEALWKDRQLSFDYTAGVCKACSTKYCVGEGLNGHNQVSPIGILFCPLGVCLAALDTKRAACLFRLTSIRSVVITNYLSNTVENLSLDRFVRGVGQRR